MARNSVRRFCGNTRHERGESADLFCAAVLDGNGGGLRVQRAIGIFNQTNQNHAGVCRAALESGFDRLISFLGGVLDGRSAAFTSYGNSFLADINLTITNFRSWIWKSVVAIESCQTRFERSRKKDKAAAFSAFDAVDDLTDSVFL